MEVLAGKSVSVKLEEGKRLDISVFPKRWATKVNMGVWEEGRHTALTFSSKSHLNFERFLPFKTAVRLTTRALNKQSQEVAGADLVSAEDYLKAHSS